MLALFLNHSPIFVAGEIALGLSLVLFIGAIIAAIGGRASKNSQWRSPPLKDRNLLRQGSLSVGDGA